MQLNADLIKGVIYELAVTLDYNTGLTLFLSGTQGKKQLGLLVVVEKRIGHECLRMEVYGEHSEVNCTSVVAEGRVPANEESGAWVLVVNGFPVQVHQTFVLVYRFVHPVALGWADVVVRCEIWNLEVVVV